MQNRTALADDCLDIADVDVVVANDETTEVPEPSVPEARGSKDDEGGTQHLGDLAQTPQLRAEANELRQCFSRYAFQSIGLCCLAIAGISKFIPELPIFGLGALSVIPIVCAASWLGVYKYKRSNRAFGYELYLERTHKIPAEFHGRWKPEYRLLSWEEAVHAWRTVEPSLFRAIYHTSRFGTPRLRRSVVRKARGPLWFMPASDIAAGGAAWEPGFYLRNVVIILFAIAVVAIAILGVSAWELTKIPADTQKVLRWLFDIWNPGGLFFWLGLLPVGSWICLAAMVVATAVTWDTWRKARHNCRKIRNGLLSVYSCSIIWQAAVVAHFTAVDKARHYKLSTSQLQEIVKHLKGKEKVTAKAGDAEQFIQRAEPNWPKERQHDCFGLPGYSFWLAQEVASLAARPLEIQEWIFNRCAHQ